MAIAVESAFEAQSALTKIETAAPAMMAAPVVPAVQPTMRRVLTNLLSAFGIGAFAANTPGAPVGSPLVLALLAWASRRETEQTFSTLARTASTSSTPVATAALTTAPTAALTTAPTAAVAAPTYPGTTKTPVAVSTNTDFIEYVTGPAI